MDDPMPGPDWMPAAKLHPLVATAQRHHGEDTVDTTDEGQRRPASQDDRVFGIPGRDTQGPAGSRVPDRRRGRGPSFGEDDADEDEDKFKYMDDEGEAPPDSAGPVDPLDIQLDDYNDPEMEAAGEAVVAAKRAGKGGVALLDEMAAAEAAYEARQQQQQQQQQPIAQSPRSADARLISKLLEVTATSQGGTPASPRSPSSARLAAAGGPFASKGGGGGGQGPPGVAPETRLRVVEHLSASLSENHLFRGRPPGWVASAAAKCEEELFASSHSKAVYLSMASNAVRVARSVPDVADLPRIASGQPRQGSAGASDTTNSVTGLQGYALKPTY